MAKTAIIPCRLLESTRQTIDQYVEALQAVAAEIGDHGLSEEEFWESGIFRSAVERIRGTQAATTEQKRQFVEMILNHLQEVGSIVRWAYSGAGERHDYELQMTDGRICIIETKGCLDGNNTNIFRRPPNADEFIIWSLCQNPGADPAHNAWSGIHTRLSDDREEDTLYQIKRFKVQHSISEYTLPVEAKIHEVRFDERRIYIELTDGRAVAIPLWWIPTLHEATAEEREKYTINRSRTMILWDPSTCDINDELRIADYLGPCQPMPQS